MPNSNIFALEKKKSDKALQWMNSYAISHNKKFSSKILDYEITTLHFGIFNVITWNGDWPDARDILKKVSDKLNMKVIETGFRQKGSILSSLVGMSKEFGKVYSDGNLIGEVYLGTKSGKWYVKGEQMR